MPELSPRPCPRCSAAPGERCRTKSGKLAAPFDHVARWNCPKCGAGKVDLKCWNCGWRYQAPKVEVSGASLTICSYSIEVSDGTTTRRWAGDTLEGFQRDLALADAGRTR